MSTLHFYYREGCHLCEDMLMELERLQSEWRFELIQIDIDHDTQLDRTYQTRVPLLMDRQGRCLSEYFLDQETLLRYLKGD